MIKILEVCLIIQNSSKKFKYNHNMTIFWPGRLSTFYIKKTFYTGPPDPLYNCSQSNLYPNDVIMDCSTAFDGGLTTTYHMELYHPDTDALVANVSSQVWRQQRWVNTLVYQSKNKLLRPILKPISEKIFSLIVCFSDKCVVRKSNYDSPNSYLWVWF